MISTYPHESRRVETGELGVNAMYSTTSEGDRRPNSAKLMWRALLCAPHSVLNCCCITQASNFLCTNMIISARGSKLWRMTTLGWSVISHTHTHTCAHTQQQQQQQQQLLLLLRLVSFSAVLIAHRNLLWS